MNRVVLGAFIGLLLAGVGLFWLQGQAEVEKGAPPPDPAALSAAAPESLPSANVSGMRGPAPPEASELSREERRFYRYDRNRDHKITRAEMLSTRADGFRALDVDGNNLLTFEEWAVTTVKRFDQMDKDHNGELSPAEFATSAPQEQPATRPRCDC
jgi:hypothetical protein